MKRRVLGIDAGYSATRRTTGLCVLEWDDRVVDWRLDVAATDEADRIDRLKGLLQGERRCEAVAVDGPLRPGLTLAYTYRAPEAALSRGAFQKRGKPGATSGGSGPRLHEAATELATLALREVEIAPAKLALAAHEAAVFEAFPNLFLGALCDEAEYPPKPLRKRKWTDTLFPRVKPQLESLVASLLPGREIRGCLETNDHEEIAGLVCALTALCAARRQLVAVGSPADGYIVLPPPRLHGRSAGEDRPWMLRELERNVATISGTFPGVRCVEHSAEDA